MTNTQMVIVGLLTVIGAMLGGMLFVPSLTPFMMGGISAAGFALGVIAMVDGITNVRSKRSHHGQRDGR